MSKPKKKTKNSDEIERMLKYSWPECPELVVETLSVVEESSPDVFDIVERRFIVEATDMTGRKWVAENPPRIPGSVAF